ncbi:MAG: hypothetical protein ACNI3A_18770 [Desulfovibrio sp.]|uniref:hypothetical protein n=1 Tax=Desulfovibrio sp. 7SRBS1 TaxID=3378064 RepID=UPI003B3E2206
MQTLIIKNGVAVYGPSATLTDKGTRAGNSFDSTTRTDNARVIEVAELPKYWRPGCFTWDGETLTATEVYSAELLPGVKAETVAAIKSEAQRRIVAVWGVDTVADSLIRQTNTLRSAPTDQRFDATDEIRTASNTFESEIDGSDLETLLGLDVRGWAGWPE